jgi:hypothetical protein
VRLRTSLQVGAKYLGCVLCRFHVAFGAGSAPCQKPVSNNLQKWFLSPTGRLNFGFITEGKLTAVLTTPSSWGSQLVRQHRTIKSLFAPKVRVLKYDCLNEFFNTKMEENTYVDSHMSNMHRIYRRLVDEFECEITNESESPCCCSRSLRAILHFLDVM